MKIDPNIAMHTHLLGAKLEPTKVRPSLPKSGWMDRFRPALFLGFWLGKTTSTEMHSGLLTFLPFPVNSHVSRYAEHIGADAQREKVRTSRTKAPSQILAGFWVVFPYVAPREVRVFTFLGCEWAPR